MIESSERPVTASVVSRANLGFLLAKASQRWNELLYARFSERGFGEEGPLTARSFFLCSRRTDYGSASSAAAPGLRSRR